MTAQKKYTRKDGLPLIHQTDLFHPHADPDDHFDLACVYALAVAGLIDLKGVLIDHPPSRRHGDPAVCAVSQMNYITGMSVPAAVGASTALSKERSDCAHHTGTREEQGVRMILDTLRESDEPVTISIAGSCRDVAIAGKRDPDLFRDKCRAVYINAGVSTNDPSNADRREYNVTLDPFAYKSIWDIPAPLFWLPCFETLEPNDQGRFTFGEHSSWFSFIQSEILDNVSPLLQQYFL